jgi:ABC-type sugar transport system ATPase subunit
MIELKQVTIKLGQFALRDVNLRIESGQYAVLMGKTGQGKTTILEAICGLRPVASGTISIRGTDVTAWSPADRQIGYVPQDLALFPNLRVREQLEFALRLRNWSKSDINGRVAELSEVLGIGHLLGRNIQGLSGGESQRVALGRALAMRPAVLLLDEPLSALDQATRNEMHDWLRKIKSNTGVTTIHVTHNSEEADALADRRLVIDTSGAIVG